MIPALYTFKHRPRQRSHTELSSWRTGDVCLILVVSIIFPSFASLSVSLSFSLFLNKVRKGIACTSIEINLREVDRSRGRGEKNKDPGRAVEMDERNHKIPDEDASDETWHDDPDLLTKFLPSLTDRLSRVYL